MLEFVAIIGKRDSGKSTIIKSLTGCSHNSYRDYIVDDATLRSVFVICSSPQESTYTITDLKKHLKDVQKKPNCLGMVMAIQPSVPTSRISMEDVLNAVVATGSFNIRAFIIDPGRKSKSAAGTSGINARLLAIGLPKATIIDGRRFAHINAGIISKRAPIVW